MDAPDDDVDPPPAPAPNPAPAAALAPVRVRQSARLAGKPKAPAQPRSETPEAVFENVEEEAQDPPAPAPGIIRAKLVPVPADGFCMFHSIVMYLDNYDNGKHLQSGVADYMWRERLTPLMKNAVNYFDLLGEARMRLKDLHRDNPNAGYDKINIFSLKDYVRQFRTGILWAGEQEVTIASNMLQRTIQICTTIHGSPNTYQMGTRYEAPGSDGIYICYNGSNHYEGLIDVQIIA